MQIANGRPSFLPSQASLSTHLDPNKAMHRFTHNTQSHNQSNRRQGAMAASSSSAAFTSASFLQRPYGAAAAAAEGGGGGEEDGVAERMYAWEGALDMSWVRLIDLWWV